MHRINYKLGVLLPATVLAVSAISALPLNAETVKVTTLRDEDTGSLNQSSGRGVSLREAVRYGTAPLKVTFDPKLSGKTITFTRSLEINKEVTIDASNLGDSIMLSTDLQVRQFTVKVGGTLNLNGLTLLKGWWGLSNSALMRGKCIHMEGGTLHASHCHFQANSYGRRLVVGPGAEALLEHCQFSGPNSGAVALVQSTGRLSLQDCLVEEGNFEQGGILTEGMLRVERCTFRNNRADSDDDRLAEGMGGAILSLGNGLAEVSDSLFQENWAIWGGGAIGAFDNGRAIIQRCTFDNNRDAIGSFDFDAGLFLPGELIIDNCTFHGDQGTAIRCEQNLSLRNSTISGNLRGVEIIRNGALTQMLNCVVAGNSEFDLIGHVSSAARNFIGGNPLLGPLADNGGLTPTMLPLTGSPLINAGGRALVETDQRGVPRADAEADIGAVELPGPVLVTTTQDDGPGSLRAALQDAKPGVFTNILFAAELDGKTIRLTRELVAGGEVVLNASGLPHGITITSQGNSRLLHLNSGSSLSGIGLHLCGGVTPHSGGALLVEGGHISLLHCVVEGCRAEGSGGALAAPGGTIRLEQCRLHDNFAEGDGGALLAQEAQIVDTLLAHNFSNGKGGGVRIDGGECDLIRSTLSDNVATAGGGLCRTGSGDLLVDNTTIYGNTGTEAGGAVWTDGPASISFENATVCANSAFEGGGLYARSGSISVSFSIIAENTASQGGPDIHDATTDELDLTLHRSSFPTRTESLIGSNETVTLQAPEDPTRVGSASQPLPGRLHPLFYYGGHTPTAHPKRNSYAQSGADGASNPYDQRQLFPRFDPNVPRDFRNPEYFDFGAVEVAELLMVNQTSGTGPGSLHHILSTLNGPAYIGFHFSIEPGTVIALTQNLPPINHPVIIDASEKEGGGMTLSGEGLRRIFTVAGTGSLTLIDVHLINGNASSGGGAIHCRRGGEVALLRCHLRDNRSSQSGGALYADGGRLILQDCLLTENSALDGGAIAGESALLLMERCHLNANTATRSGGAISLHHGQTRLSRCSLHHNVASFGGALRLTGDAQASLLQSTVSDNESRFLGGGLHMASTGKLTLSSATLADNKAAAQGGGIYLQAGSLSLQNSIISSNRALPGSEDLFRETPDLPVTASGPNLLSRNSTVTTEMPSDGVLIGSAASPVQARLAPLTSTVLPTRIPLSGSPAIDRGGLVRFLKDQAGNPRVVGEARDLGATERQSSAVATYGEWAAALPAGLPREFDQDGDADGLSNGREYGLGTEGAFQDADSPLVPRQSTSDNGLTYQFSFGVNLAARDLTWIVRRQSGNDTIVLYRRLGADGSEQSRPGISLQWTDHSVTLTDHVPPTGPVHYSVEILESSAPLPFDYVTVTTREDEDDGVPNSQMGSGLSLREALDAVINQGTIYFAHELSGTVLLNGSHLSIPKEVTIDASNRRSTQVIQQLSEENRHFRVESGAHLNLKNVTLVNGRGASRGGSILIEGGAATLIQCQLAHNTSIGDRALGGAIALSKGSELTMTDCTLSENSSFAGGALHNDGGMVDLLRCAFSQNSSTSGGAVYNERVFPAPLDQPMRMTNCTFSNNRATSRGGAVYSNTGTTLIHCTVSGNSAAQGGGLAHASSPPQLPLRLVQCIVAGNSADQGRPFDISMIPSLFDGSIGLLESTGENLIGRNTSAESHFRPKANLVGTASRPVNPFLGQLAYNGGLTPTMALLPQSSAIDRGEHNLVPTDQRGVSRTAPADLGAYERFPLADYEAWSEFFHAEGEDRSIHGDPDGDGNPNGLEWALGSHPGRPDSMGPGALQINPPGNNSGSSISFGFNPDAAATATWIVRRSTDLENWTELYRLRGRDGAVTRAVGVRSAERPDHVLVFDDNSPQGSAFYTVEVFRSP